MLVDRRLESEMTMQEEISSAGSDIESNPDHGLMMGGAECTVSHTSSYSQRDWIGEFLNTVKNCIYLYC